MVTGDDTRPDGRTSSAETLALRAATRVFRLHLDELPIDYDERVAPDRFLSGLAFILARNRYACSESLIGAGFGGTVVGAMARSVLVDGLRWLWIARDPSRRVCLLGDLVEERSGIASLLRPDCPTLTRMLMPVPAVADLTGASRGWLDATSVPNDDALLDELFAYTPLNTPSDPAQVAAVGGLAPFLEQAHRMLDLAGLRGAAMVLAHAGHGNYLGQRSALAEDGTPGFDLRADHEALFMHVAAVGAYAVLVGSAAAAPDAWPHDVDRTSFLSAAATLANDVAMAATAIHGLAAKTKAGRRTSKRPPPPKTALLHGAVVIETNDVLGELPDIDRRLAVLVAALKHFEALVVATPPPASPPSDDVPLHAYLSYGAALSSLQTVLATYDQLGGQVMCVFAARALLEEAARLGWRYSVQDDEAKARAKQYFDEFRFRQRKAIRTLVGHGINRKDALRLFQLPANVLTPPGVDEIAKNRAQIPSTTTMLRSFASSSNDPEWLVIAYKLMSQVTHATPLGYLHCMRYVDGNWIPNELSVEMFALALDAAALGSGYLLGVMGVLFNDVSPSSQRQHRSLLKAAGEVHHAAREIHGLDLPAQARRT